MVWMWFKPPDSDEQKQVTGQALRAGHNYDSIGATDGGFAVATIGSGFPSSPWVIDHRRVQLGHGKALFQHAKKLMQGWSHFQLGWTSVAPDTPVKEGAGVCVVAKTLFMWSANPLKIVYVRDHVLPSPVYQAASSGSSGSRRAGPLLGKPKHIFSFAHGCLDGHLLAGEERFAVEWDTQDDSVWFDIYTFSRPAHPLALVTYPLVRWYQKQFAQDSSDVMLGHAAQIVKR